MTAHQRERVDESFCLLLQRAERLRARAWNGYLATTRDAPLYHEVEPEAWRLLQERLAVIDEELMHALGSG